VNYRQQPQKRNMVFREDSTGIKWLRKYGTFDSENQPPSHMPKSKEQKILELVQKIKLLEKQKTFWEKQAKSSDKKVIFFDMMIAIAEKKFNIPIRKNSLPEQSTDSQENTK
jgi:hypothetical protein